MLVFCASSKAADWPAYRHDAARSAATEEAPPANPPLRWTLKLPKLEPAWPDQERLRCDGVYLPIVVGNMVIVASSRDDSICGYDLASGSRRWRVFADGPVRVAPAADDKGRVFVGSDDGHLYALSAADGKLLWKIKGAPQRRLVLGNKRIIDTWPVRGGPVVADGKVYFAAGLWPFMGVFLRCVDAETGKEIWTNSGEGASYQIQPHSAPAFGSISPQGSLVVWGDKLIVPNGRAAPAVFERATGKFLFFPLNGKTGGDEVVAHESYFYNGGIGFEWEKGKPAALVTGSPVAGQAGELLGVNSKGVHRLKIGEPDKPFEEKLSADGKSRSVVLKVGPRIKIAPQTSAEIEGVTALVRAGDRLVVGGKGFVGTMAPPEETAAAKLTWKTDIAGTVDHLLVANGAILAVTEEGTIYAFGAGAAGVGLTTEAAGTSSSNAAELERQVKAAIADAKVAEGYALVAGSGGYYFARQLVADTNTHVVMLDGTADNTNHLRRVMDDATGHRVGILTGTLQHTPLPPYFASIAIVDGVAGDADISRVFQCLHPYNGLAYFTNADAATITAFAARHPGHAAVSQLAGITRLARVNGVAGGGNWTNEHANAANTRVSADTVVKAPLGVLWFGGSSNDGILPRHGHGPQPQVLDGRCYIQGIDFLRAVDIYTGRVLWEASIPGVGSFFDETLHQPGANGTGSNFVSRPDGIYVANDRVCLVLDPATGKTLRTIEIPKPIDGGPDWVLSYANVEGDYFIGGVAPKPKVNPALAPPKKPSSKKDDDIADGDGPVVARKGPITSVRTVGSKRLWVADRRTGRVIWSAEATDEFRHNGIAIGGGRLYAIDTPTTPVPTSLLGAVKAATQASTKTTVKAPGRIIAFDLATGVRRWTHNKAFGTWLSYSAEHDVLMEAGRYARDTLKDEPKGMRAFRAATGEALWHDPLAVGPAMIRGRWVLKEKNAADLITGEPIEMTDPITGLSVEWAWARNYGCNTPVASQNLMTFRSGAAGFYDLARCGGTGNFGGFRSSCTNNLLVAGGLLVAPDYTRTCICGYPIQTSVAMVPDEAVEMWTFAASDSSPKAPVQRVGVNLGAPGDRVADDGTLWLEYPGVGGKSPKLDIKLEGLEKELRYVRRHASELAGPLPWVAGSGVANFKSIEITVDDEAEKKKRQATYTVRLVLATTADGTSPADVLVQGKPVERGVKVESSKPGVQSSLVREYRGVVVGKSIRIDLQTPKGGTPPLVGGVEIIRQ